MRQEELFLAEGMVCSQTRGMKANCLQLCVLEASSREERLDRG